MRTFARDWLYPLLWAWTAACMWTGAHHPELLGAVVFAKATVTVAILFLFEWATPLQPRWGMTLRHLMRRDVPMILINALCLAAINYGLLLFAIDTSSAIDGPLSGRPLWLQVLTGLLVFEALQYTVHRAMHRGDGVLFGFLWRCHAIHHLPQQLYVVMHGVFHPVNAILVRMLVQVTPVVVLGFDPIAVFLYGSVIALHGMVSHFNVDMRLGVLNYVFVGPELHRHHHSASTAEAMNYGAALSWFDLLFGTFHYRPGVVPRELGLSEAAGYPGQDAPVAALLFPFHRASQRGVLDSQATHGTNLS